MKRLITVLFGGAIAAFLLVNASCSKKGGDSNANSGPDSVLINIGYNLILPAYHVLASQANALDAAITDFNTSPDATKLANVQTLFKSTYVALQSTSEYDGFGPAYSIQPSISGINLFPANIARIDSNIANGSFNVNLLSSLAAKGFPALDYLLFADGANTLADYTTNAGAVNRKQYLAAVSADIKSEVNATANGWDPSGGNYINTFVSGTGNSVSGSLGLLINSMDQDFEILKNDRLGIPLGKQPPGGNLGILPKEVEAYYSGISAQLALAQLKAVQALYLGTTANGNSLGLQNYIISKKVQYNGGQLSDAIKALFAKTATDMSAIPDPLSATIQSNPAPSTAVYVELQQLVVLLKTDMPSSLGILITYGDNDGD